MKGPSCPFVLEARRETARAFHRSRDVRDQRVVFAQQRGSANSAYSPISILPMGRYVLQDEAITRSPQPQISTGRSTRPDSGATVELCILREARCKSFKLQPR